MTTGTIGNRGHRTVWRFLLAAAIAFAVTMALLPHPPHVGVVTNDKVQHMAAFGTLTLLAALAYPRASLLRTGERLSFLGAMIEVAQSIPTLHRDCDIMDWVADTAVIVVMLLIVRLARGRRDRPAP